MKSAALLTDRAESSSAELCADVSLILEIARTVHVRFDPISSYDNRVNAADPDGYSVSILPACRLERQVVCSRRLTAA